MSKNKILSPVFEQILEEGRKNQDEACDIYAEKMRQALQEMDHTFVERLDHASLLLQQRFGTR